MTMGKSPFLRFSRLFTVAVVMGWFVVQARQPHEMAASADGEKGQGGGVVGLGLPDTGAELPNGGEGLCWDSYTELCIDQPGVIERNCNDGIDNDGDGRTDCLDPFKDVDCDAYGAGQAGCFNERDSTDNGSTTANCTDGVDNDGDGLTDAPADPDCCHGQLGIDLGCPPPETHCADMVDNDLDGLTDCKDPDCISDRSEAIEIPCSQTGDCPGQDGFYSTGCPAEDRYGARSHPDDNETVTDRCTGLMWQREHADLSGDGLVASTGSGQDRMTSWCEALRYCEDLTYAGFSDWRLPNVRELQSLADARGPMPPVFGQELRFDPSQRSVVPYYWTSTPSLKNPVNGVDFDNPGAPKASLDGVYVPAAWVVDFNSNIVGGVVPQVDKNGAAGADTGDLEYKILLQHSSKGNLVRAVRTFSPEDFVAAGDGGERGGVEEGGGAGVPACSDDSGNVNGDGARDLSDAVYLLAWLFQGGPFPASFCTSPGPKEVGCAQENGNTNGDESRDLSDVIYLLAWLFQGGPAPALFCGGTPPEICDDLGVDEDGDGLTDCDDLDCAGIGNCPQPETDCTNGQDDDDDGDVDCADSDCSDDAGCPEDCEDGVDNDADGDMDCSDSECTGEPQCGTAALGQLPATGTSQCYDAEGDPIPCANDADCPGQDGDYQSGCPTAGRFVDNGDGTVTDTCANLMWQKDTADTNGDMVVNASDKMHWCDALIYCEVTLNAAGGFAGKSGWRMPNFNELHSIVDFSEEHPALDTSVFDATAVGDRPTRHHTSTSGAETGCAGDCEWIIWFDIGRMHGGDSPREFKRNHIRAVRDAP
jgi:hypothetical protein